MTPFGWRFAGALAGTLSVPLLYLLARRLRLRPGWALAAAALFALDFMRFVQSRMATPEPFVLLFVLLFYYFLLGFLRDAEHDPARSAWRRRGFAWGPGQPASGSASTRWRPPRCLGLALLWRKARAARLRSPGEPATGAVLRLALLGLGALVLLPAAVYLASYLPLLLRQGWRLADVLAHQGHMFRYHSLVSETRWYASSWWQWPLMVRPVWLYTPAGGPAGGLVGQHRHPGQPCRLVGGRGGAAGLGGGGVSPLEVGQGI